MTAERRPLWAECAGPIVSPANGPGQRDEARPAYPRHRCSARTPIFRSPFGHLPWPLPAMLRRLAWAFLACWSFAEVLTRFVQEPSDKSVVSGRATTLMCIIANYSGIVQWTKDGLALGAEHHLPGWPRYSIIGSTAAGEHNLHLSHAELADDASYECQATQAALRSRPARLTVLIPPDNPIILGGPEVKLKAEKPFNLTCYARRARPAATISWFRDGVPQRGATYAKSLLSDMKREDAVSMLTIMPSSADVGCTYTCRVSNKALPEGKQTSISLNVQHPPKVHISVNPQPVQEGESVRFTCSATANPEITAYRWAKHGLLIDGVTGSEYETTVDYTYYTEPVSCEVQNAVGSTNVSTLVDVYFSPRIMTEPQPATVNTGSDASFTCVWSGNPPLSLTWTRLDSSLVLSNSNVLRLSGVTQSDAGEYVCKATVPRIGVGERTVSLSVKGPPIISSDLVQHAVRGEKGHVECFIGSKPQPDRIAWAWKENVLEVGTYERYTVETVSGVDGVLSTLTISNVVEADFQTLYNCTAWNSFGSDTEIFTLQEKAKKDIKICKHDPKVEIVHKDFDQIRKDMPEEDIKLPVMNGDQKFNFYPVYTDELDTKTEETSTGQEDADYKDLKDPTNGYYNVRAHEEQSATRNAFSDFHPLGRPLYEPRPPSRLSHASGYAQLATFSPQAYDYEAALGPQPDVPTRPAFDRPTTTTAAQQQQPHHQQQQVSLYGSCLYAPAATTPFHNGSVYSFGRMPNYDGVAEAYEAAAKPAGRFSYASSQHSDFSRPPQQRMQTHV
uniref:kin of IRRE-like protein 1 isoform X2 n=1 Tax=Myxine glutinosa TaxID=7769 RepID=UPI0035902862